MNCAMCGANMKAEAKSKLHYTMSGLSKVYLSGVSAYQCINRQCGEEEIEIPNIEELHALLANIIARQETKLLPEEIRFLRTHLGYSGVDFSRKIGVDAATVSRWENGKATMGDLAERLLRLMILAKVGPITDYEMLDSMAQKDAKAPVRRMLKMYRSHWVEDKIA